MKKKVALFYDENTENGRMILKFLKPFDKRKSDIVGRLILTRQMETVMQQEQKEDLPHDKELVRAGLAAFMG